MLGCLAARYDVLALVKPQFELGRGRVGKGGVVRDAGDRREALVARRRRPRSGSARRVRGYHSSGLPGPKGNRETLHLAVPSPRGREGASSAAADARGAGARGRAVREITVFTHRRPDDTAAALRPADRARRAGPA